MTGSARVKVHTASELPSLSWRVDVENTPDAWPFLAPSWLAGTTAGLATEAKPLHVVATRARGETGVLPGYLFDAPAGVDWDPRTYLGWEAPDGTKVCCGVTPDRTASDEVDGWGPDALFPSLVVGSPLGYRSEPAYNFWSAGMIGTLTETLRAAAAEAGARSVVAPWVPDRAGNEEILTGIRCAGGGSTFWGLEDHLPLEAGSYAEHLESLPRKRRQRVRHDQVMLARSGLSVRHVRGQDLAPYVDRVAELVCLNREKNGASQQPHQITAILHELLAADADLWGYLGERDGAVVAACVAVRRRRRLFVKWAGFDYDVVGERSGLYFPFAFDMPMRDAYAEGVRSMELGAGAHEAKALRGCTSRSISTALWVRDEALRPRATALLTAFGQRRRRTFDDAEPRPSTTILPLAGGGDDCCGGAP
ncbi:GNAT family N-acetyltransferase [Phycicoccus sp. CSK15P-2]|uniref:GNAT family N-acetyltransferase n=1 Tax=Phycicoccus sp. CSK15P-2 TaxID=2807627 RepID=UPI0019527717|nr:GNAT family N-acetyltransferase [Phycicoccus sp. CSK15P-2]MBM6405932.1 GNAT family N-acetyltransferase [Phycicoccus sp. CSK15P-2]